jgi:hypothetical protein
MDGLREDSEEIFRARIAGAGATVRPPDHKLVGKFSSFKAAGAMSSQI